MNLFINTVDSNYGSFAIFQSRGVVLYLCEFIDKQERLNKKLTAFLKSKKIKPQEFKAVMVVTGPGSFSASRAGVVLANAFNFLYGIPVLGIKDSGTSPNGASIEEMIRDNLGRLKRSKKTTVAEVYYENPPNITIKK